jgi:hypothetical protein
MLGGQLLSGPATAQSADQSDCGLALPGSYLDVADLPRERLSLCNLHAQVVVEPILVQHHGDLERRGRQLACGSLLHGLSVAKRCVWLSPSSTS